MATLMTGYAESGLTTAKFVRLRASDGFWWSTSAVAFQVYAAGSIANYGIAATEVGSTGIYTATDPSDTTAGDYLLVKAAVTSLAVSDVTTGVRWQNTVAVAGAANATALLDLADGVESGKTLRQALRLIAAACAGKRSNTGTTSEQFDAVGNPGTARIVSGLDSSGNGTPTLTP